MERRAGTALTNLMTGRLARGVFNRIMCEFGPMGEVPKFPLAAGAVAPLRAKAEAAGLGDFSPMWSGQAAALGRAMPAGDLTKALVAETEHDLPPRWREHIGRKQRQRLGGPTGPREAIK